MATIVCTCDWVIRRFRTPTRFVIALAVTGCGGSGSDMAPLPAPQNVVSPTPFYTGTLHRDAGRTVLTIQYGVETLPAGPDRQFFTSDDAVQSYTLDAVDVTGTRRTHSTTMTAGNDNLLFTADDNTGYYEIVEKDNSGQTKRTLYFNSSGPDQIAFTADDEITMYDALQDDGALSRLFIGPGDDGTWLTSDDTPGNTYTRIEPPNSTTRFQKRSQYESGPDGLIATDDDILCFITETWDLGAGVWEKATVSMDRCGLVTGTGAHGSVAAFDATGRNLRHLIIETPGNDGLWLTTDDVTKLRVTVTSKELQTLYTLYATDGSIALIIDDQFDPANRNNFRTLNHSGPGEDTEWLTPDDSLTGYTTQREQTVSATVTERTTKKYSQAGTDNIWFTADDVLGDVVVNVIGTQ